MLPWSRDELRTLATEHPEFKGVSDFEEKFERRFYRFGGQARSFFASDLVEQRFLDNIDRAISSLLENPRATAHSVLGLQFSEEVDRVLYRVLDRSVSGPDTPGCTFSSGRSDGGTILEIGSAYIKQEFMEKCMVLERVVLRDFMKTLSSSFLGEYGASMFAVFFEAAVHNHFRESLKESAGKVTLDGCKDGREYDIEYSKCATFDDELAGVEEGVYYETRGHNFPAIDSFIWAKGHVTGFQIASQRTVTKQVNLRAIESSAFGKKFVELVAKAEGSKNSQLGPLRWTIYVIVPKTSQVAINVTPRLSDTKMDQHSVHVRGLLGEESVCET